jgi:hypothetical protein
MLSRSNTTTSDRARRARSTVSMQAARQRSSATSDPLVIRRNAEAAATEAYRRAQPAEPPNCLDYRPAPAMLHRRRSQVTGRSEGSHLEDARLGRRRSTARREEAKSTPLPRQRPHSEQVPTVMKENETRAKRTTFVQPQSAAKSTHRNEGLNPVATSHFRDSNFEYSNGSPAARTTSAKSEVRGSSIPQTPRHTDKSYDDGISVTYTEPQPYATGTKAESHISSRRVSIRETQTDEEIITLARDRQLQESQQHKLRERKSFFGSLQMLQKRDRHSEPPGIVYDSSLPPFNYADDSLIAPLPPTHDFAPSVPYLDASVVLERKTRAFSISVKGKFKKLLRKASRLPSGLMMQHADKESNSHLIVDHDDLMGIDTTSVLTDPFVVHGSPLAPGRATGNRILSASNDGNASIDGESAADRSRVTSWTNSTAAGTSSTYANTASTSVADEHGRLVSDKSRPALRKKSSFFGRAVQNRLRKVSRADLKSSEDSQALFTALRERILPQDEKADQAESNASLASWTSSALSTLPSQKRADSLASSVRGPSLTIRTVSPDMNYFQIQTMSPVVEASPERDAAHDEAADHTPTADHFGSRSKRMLVQADPPSPERIARRVQQSQARWKSALHGNSAASNGKVASAYDDDSPYELPSLSRNPYADNEVDTGGLPRHARVHAPPAGFREGLLSPSVYSRATDGTSPQPVTPEPSGTKVTITSREVKRYDISPSKKNIVTAQRPIQASSEWRKWLSDEMTSLAVQNEVDSLDMPQQPETSLATSIVDAPGRRRATTNGSGSQRPSTDTPSSDQASKGRKGSRPRANSRRSSYMNERYPMVESSGNSSRRTSRKCSMGSNAGTDTERSLQIPGSDDSKHNVNGTVTSSKSGASRLLPKRHSLANLESLSKSKQPFTSKSTTEPVPGRSLTPGAVPGQAPVSTTHLHPPTHHKHKPAFDLRAKYKSNVTSASRPLEVRRKTTVPLPITVFEDNTIQNISAGPYATASASNANANANNKENTPPHIVEDGGLPALSSSEWLAGPTSKKRDPKARPKSSPPKSSGLVAGNGNGREGSPGQRLVTGWLEGRKGKSGDGEVAFL